MGCFPVSAQSSPHVVILTDAQPPAHVGETATRFDAELRAAGFVVERAQVGQGDPRAEVEASARGRGAYAGLYLHGDATVLRAHLWLAGTRVHASARSLSVEGSAESPGDFALQLAEFLQAGLTDVRAVTPPPTQPEPASSEPPPAAPATQVTDALPATNHDPPLGIVLDVGPSLRGRAALDDPLLGVRIAAGYRLAGDVLLGLAATLPLHDVRYDAAGGSAFYQFWSSQLRLEVRLLSWRALAVVASAQGGVAQLSARGQPDAPLLPRSDAAWTAIGTGLLGLRASVSSRLSLTLDAGASVLAPQPQVAVDDATRTVGAPMLVLSLGLRLTT